MNINLAKIASNVCKISYNQVRNFREIPEFEGGIKYYGFTYHPRFPDEKDPPYKPTKMFLVERIKPVFGTNRVEREILEKLNINGEKKYCGHVNIVKNIPQVNAGLWKVKHLVKITPIRLKDGLPEDGDLTGCWLKENGEFIVSPKLKIDEQRIKASYDFKNEPKRLDRETLQRRLRLEWEGPFHGVTE